jgi:hypothetical protein
MTNGATGHAITGRNKGWRKAVRFALTENPVTVARPQLPEDDFRLVNETGQRLSELAPAQPVRYKGNRTKKQGAVA